MSANHLPIIEPGSPAHMVLLALRAGEMEPGQLHERFISAAKELSGLVRMGLVRMSGDFYRITPEGRAACPSRRDIKSLVDIAAPAADKTPEPKPAVKLKPQVRSVQPRRVETPQNMQPGEPMKAKFEAVAIVTHVKNNPGINYDNLVKHCSPANKFDEIKFQKMLCYCIAQKFLSRKVVAGEKIYYLGSNEVWLAQQGLLPVTTPKEPTESGVATTHSESAVKPAVQQTSPEAQASEVSLDGGDQSDAEGTASTAESTVEPQSSPEENIPSFIEAAPSLVAAGDVTAPEPDFIGTDLGAGDVGVYVGAYGKFKVGYLSDGSLTLHGLGVLPIELNKSQVEVLLDFIDKVGLSWSNFELSSDAP